MLAGIAVWQPSIVPRPEPDHLLLSVLAIVAAFGLRFIVQSILTMACFWSERAAALDRLMLIPYVFLSGLVAPLSTFPPAMRTVAEATPFPWMLAFPAALLAGQDVNVAAGFAAIVAWSVGLLPLVVVLWRLGVRRYSAMGA